MGQLQQVLGPGGPLDAPGGTRSDTTVGVERRDGQAVVTVDGIDPKGEFINFLDGQLGVVNPDKRQSVVELEQVGPGRYRGTFPSPGRGRLPGRL